MSGGEDTLGGFDERDLVRWRGIDRSAAAYLWAFKA